MTPLGLHHIMAAGHHFGPGPWVSQMPRADWTSTYYHKADESGVGFDRTRTGSNALEQYAPAFAAQYTSLENCPKEFLLWFHHVPWDHKLASGRSLWEELCREYQQGVDLVAKMKDQWTDVKQHIDAERFRQVEMHLAIQQKEAKWWRDACLSYFQTIFKKEMPAEFVQPKYDLKYYQSLSYP